MEVIFDSWNTLTSKLSRRYRYPAPTPGVSQGIRPLTKSPGHLTRRAEFSDSNADAGADTLFTGYLHPGRQFLVQRVGRPGDERPGVLRVPPYRP
jgi:hypothetical protein